MAYSLPVTSVSNIRRLLDEAKAAGKEITPGMVRTASSPYIKEELERILRSEAKRRKLYEMEKETALSEKRGEIERMRGETELSRLETQGEQLERERANATVKGGIELAKLGVQVYPKLKAMLAGWTKGIPVPATSTPMSTAAPYSAGGLEWPITPIASSVPEATAGATTGAGVTGASTGIVAGTEAGTMLPATAIPMAGAEIGGAVAGAEAGAEVGATAGSAIPGIGTIVGILGGIAVGGILSKLLGGR